MRPTLQLLLVGAVACALLASACKDDKVAAPAGPNVPEGAVPEFSALDVNPTSPRFDELVSPRDYLGQVSAWYFGHAT